MHRFNRNSYIVCHCNSPEEAVIFINYCNENFLDPQNAYDAKRYVGNMFRNTLARDNEINDCVRYYPGSITGTIGHCSKEYYLERGHHVYEFSELRFAGFDESEIIIDSDYMTDFLDLL